MRNHRTARWIVLATLGALACVVPTASADRRRRSGPAARARATSRSAAARRAAHRARAGQRLPRPRRARHRAVRERRCRRPGRRDPRAAMAATRSDRRSRRSRHVDRPRRSGPRATRRRRPTAASADATRQRRRLGHRADGPATRTPGTCDGTRPCSAASESSALSVNGNEILIPTTAARRFDFDLLPLITIKLNETVRTGRGTADESLTQRAVQVELLEASATQPARGVVIGEAKVDRHGAVCAPEPPPPPTCPAGSVPQPRHDPLVCVKR